MAKEDTTSPHGMIHEDHKDHKTVQLLCFSYFEFVNSANLAIMFFRNVTDKLSKNSVQTIMFKILRTTCHEGNGHAQ